jgi:hypothetical protein
MRGPQASKTTVENMAFETVLLLTVAPAAIAAIAISVYAILSEKKNAVLVKTSSKETSPIFPEAQEFVQRGSALDQGTNFQGEVPMSSVPSQSVASAPIQEAPSPFPEENNSTSSTSAPTDVTALANLGSGIQGTTPNLLVIPTPKRRSRPKRLPGEAPSGAPRKRRAPRSKLIAPKVPATDPQATVSESSPESSNSSGSTSQIEE